MKKLKSSLINMALVLTIIALVAGGVLAYVNSVTAPQIQKINQENLDAGIRKVMGSDDIKVAAPQELQATIAGKEKTFVVYGVTNAQGENLGCAVQTCESGFGGELKVLVGFDPTGTILGYTILQHAETPGLGAKAGLWFQKEGKGNIIGRNPGERKLQVSKITNDPEDVDAITASTITSRAFLLAIQNAYDQVIAKPADGTTGATQQAQKK